MMIVGPELRKGRLRGENVTLRSLLALAFGMTEPRVIGSEWLGDKRFEVMAKSPEDVPDSELNPTLRTLLKERFGLVAHSDTRKMPVYYLKAAKGGPTMPVYPAPGRVPAQFEL
jgi:uncharacterized protein (TIGR03435 family)